MLSKHFLTAPSCSRVYTYCCNLQGGQEAGTSIILVLQEGAGGFIQLPGSLQLSHEAVWLHVCLLHWNVLQEEEVWSGNGLEEDCYRGQQRLVTPWRWACVQRDPWEGQIQEEKNSRECPLWERELVHEGSWDGDKDKCPYSVRTRFQSSVPTEGEGNCFLVWGMQSVNCSSVVSSCYRHVAALRKSQELKTQRRPGRLQNEGDRSPFLLWCSDHTQRMSHTWKRRREEGMKNQQAFKVTEGRTELTSHGLSCRRQIRPAESRLQAWTVAGHRLRIYPARTKLSLTALRSEFFIPGKNQERLNHAYGREDLSKVSASDLVWFCADSWSSFN